MSFGLAQAMGGTFQPHNASEVVDSLRRAFYYYSETGDSDRAEVIASYSHVPLNLGGEIIAKALELVTPFVSLVWEGHRYRIPFQSRHLGVGRGTFDVPLRDFLPHIYNPLEIDLEIVTARVSPALGTPGPAKVGLGSFIRPCYFSYVALRHKANGRRVS